MIGRRWSASRLLLVCGVVLAVGCGSSPPLLRGAINVDPNVNPDRAGRPSPIVVRIYELKSIAAFNGADFFALFDKEPETLSGELVGREEFQLQPGESRQYRRQLQPETKFIGVVGAFRDLEQARWRQAVPVPAKGSPTITIGLQARAVTVAVK
ncbi:MAG: type VI secretion system lipoprotein TssJ [Candidatus Rokuibacteriota bacterium]